MSLYHELCSEVVGVFISLKTISRNVLPVYLTWLLFLRQYCSFQQLCRTMLTLRHIFVVLPLTHLTWHYEAGSFNMNFLVMVNISDVKGVLDSILYSLVGKNMSREWNKLAKSLPHCEHYFCHGCWNELEYIYH